MASTVYEREMRRYDTQILIVLLEVLLKINVLGFFLLRNQKMN